MQGHWKGQMSPRQKKGEEIMFSYKFYDGTKGKQEFLSAATAIMLVSKPYIHVEGLFSNGISFSSEFGIGPRLKRITYSHPERWNDVACQWITPVQEKNMWLRACLHNQMRIRGRSKYDTRGAAGCLITGEQNPWDWFCSEVNFDILPEVIRIDRVNYKMHPVEFRNVILDINRIMASENLQGFPDVETIDEWLIKSEDR